MILKTGIHNKRVDKCEKGKLIAALLVSILIAGTLPYAGAAISRAIYTLSGGKRLQQDFVEEFYDVEGTGGGTRYTINERQATSIYNAEDNFKDVYCHEYAFYSPELHSAMPSAGKRENAALPNTWA